MSEKTKGRRHWEQYRTEPKGKITGPFTSRKNYHGQDWESYTIVGIEENGLNVDVGVMFVGRGPEDMFDVHISFHAEYTIEHGSDGLSSDLVAMLEDIIEDMTGVGGSLRIDSRDHHIVKLWDGAPSITN